MLLSFSDFSGYRKCIQVGAIMLAAHALDYLTVNPFSRCLSIYINIAMKINKLE